MSGRIVDFSAHINTISLVNETLEECVKRQVRETGETSIQSDDPETQKLIEKWVEEQLHGD